MINFGDIVWITHIEEDAYLSAKKVDRNNGQSTNFLGNIAVGYELEYTQKYELNGENKRYGNTNGMWILESEKGKKGGLLEKGMFLRIKHMAFG
jgi:hypothetical protein